MSLQGVPTVRHNVHNIASRCLRRRTACFKSALRTPQARQHAGDGLGEQYGNSEAAATRLNSFEGSDASANVTPEASEDHVTEHAEADVQVSMHGPAATSDLRTKRRSVIPLVSAPPSPVAVSYTHLTLPTICSV